MLDWVLNTPLFLSIFFKNTETQKQCFLSLHINYIKFILPNSANTTCRLFQVKINCSKFIIDGQRCHMTFLVSLFVTSRNLLFGVFLSRKIITIPQKNICKSQASVTERCTCLSKRSGMFRQNLLKVPVKKLLQRLCYT